MTDTTHQMVKLRKIAIKRRLLQMKAWLDWIIWKLSFRREKGSYELPSIQKRIDLLNIMRARNFNLFVETGTFLGDTTYYFARKGYDVITIEVDALLASHAKMRFEKMSNVRVIEGDSANCLHDVVSNLASPTLFWLDGHYSGGITGKGKYETPIMSEVQTIIRKAPKGSIVLVDDARCFGALPDYPELNEFRSYLESEGIDDVLIENDRIQFTV